MKPSRSELNSRAALLFFLAAALTVAWSGLSYAFPDAAPTGIPNMLLLILLCNGILLVGLWLGLVRTNFSPGTRLAVWLAIAVPFILWTAAKINVDPENAFQPSTDVQGSGTQFKQGIERYNVNPWVIPVGVKLSVIF